jgi:hypothetical protein
MLSMLMFDNDLLYVLLLLIFVFVLIILAKKL